MSSVVARGRIKVDARKALDKLRDHMLVDPHLWGCEIARVAVALGATRLDVDWDTDELVFDFDGRALAPDQIAHARDSILTPLDGPDGDALRLLGIGIGAALSLDPSYIEVLSSGQRVRFDRKYMEASDAAPTPVAAPNELPAGKTTRVRFKRKLGFDLLARIVEAPEEIPLLRQAFEAPSCTLYLRGAAAPRREVPVLTVDLDVPGTTRAHLEILRRPVEPQTDFLQYGVRLSTYEVSGLWNLANRARAQLPLRFVIDAPDLPTNASRSQVRNDAPLVERALARCTPAFALAVAALRGQSTTNAAKIGHTVAVNAEPAVLTDVLGAIAAEAALAIRASHAVEALAQALLDDEVAMDALGRKISLRSLRGGSLISEPLRIYEGPEPLPAELAPWLGGTIWKRGLSSERALEGLHLASVKDLVAPALDAMQRRQRSLEHPASKPVTASNAAWKEAFRVKSGPFAGLEGEVALRAGKDATKPSIVRVYVDERLLEAIPVPGTKLPVDLALAWPERLIANFAYTAVERNEQLTRALHYALRVAALAVGRHRSEPPLLRAGCQTWSDATRALGDGRVEPAGFAELASIPAWRTNDGRLVPLTAIYGYVQLTGALCFATSTRPAPDGRLVISAEDAPVLRSVLGIELVSYEAALSADHEASEGIPSLAVLIHRPNLDGFVAPSPDKISRLRVYHAGICYRREMWPARNGPVELVLIDRAAVPRADGKGFHYASGLPSFDSEEDALVEVVTQACESEAVDLTVVENYLEVARTMILDRKDNKPLAKRIHALPQRREERRRGRLKAAVRARTPIDVSVASGGKVRGTFVQSKKGAVSVSLGPLGPATILYEGHPVGTELVGRLELEAYIDVVDDDFVEEWSKLSDAGRSWAEDAVIAAAVSLVETLSGIDGFAESESALKLLLALSPEQPLRIGQIVTKAPWPTVQGGTIALGSATQANCGVNHYGPWRPGVDASPYDAAAIHLPNTKVGELRRKILLASGIVLTDVTDATTRLQALRAKSEGAAPPALGGTPAFPSLRRSLAKLGATFLEGELELIDGVGSDIACVRSNGVREAVPIDIGCPVRVVYRSDTDDMATASRDLMEATKALLQSLVPKLEKLPPFVARRVRAMVLAEVASAGRINDADRNIPIFEATNGRFYRLSFLQGYAGYTTDPPPYPPVDDIELCLTLAEASALSKVFDLRDHTHVLRARARGLAARAAPPLTEIRVKEREQCMFFIDVNEDGIKGEIGLLKPSHAGARRVDVYTTMRPITTMADPEGWPVIAALNDDALQVDDAFSELTDPKHASNRFHQLIRRLVGSSLSRLLVAPPENLGIVRLPVPLLLRSVRSKRTAAAMGVFWLPKEWPERPSIQVEGVGIVDPERPPLMELVEGASSRLVPLHGKLWVTAEASDLPRAIEDAMAWVSARLAAHIRGTAAHPPKDSRRYLWDLALLGLLEDDAMDPRAELAKDRPDPDLMHVAARRAPQLIDRATGDAPTPPTYVQHAVETPEIVEDAAVVFEPRSTPPPPVDEGFLAGLVRRVTELVTGGPEVLEETPLTAALSQSIGALALTGQPVRFVQASKKGRPITYHRASQRLIVNAKHEVVEKLVARDNGLLFLVLAALSEINRELVEVTDAEEVAAILDMLRANQSR